MPPDSPTLGRRAATRCLERSLMRFTQRVVFEAIRFHRSEFQQLRYNLQAFLRFRKSRLARKVFKGIVEVSKKEKEIRQISSTDFRDKNLLKTAWQGFMELWDLTQRRNRTIVKFAAKYRTFKSLKALGEYVRVQKEKRALKEGVLEYYQKIKRRRLFKHWRLLYLMHLKAKVMRYQARALDSEKKNLTPPIMPTLKTPYSRNHEERRDSFPKDTLSTFKRSHEASLRESLQSGRPPHPPSHTAFRVKYSDYCKCEECVKAKIDIIPEFDSQPYVASQQPITLEPTVDQLTERVQKIEQSLLRSPFSSLTFQKESASPSKTLSESEVSPPKHVTFQINEEPNISCASSKQNYKTLKKGGSKSGNELHISERLRQKRISNVTRSTDMPSQRDAIISHTSPKIQSSGRRSISPTLPGGTKQGTLKTTLPTGGKKKSCGNRTKKFYYQRSYDELVDGKIERSRQYSPYYKKTVSFMAKNLD